MDPNAVIEVFRRNVTTRYFAFEGRTGVREFWYYVLAYVVLFIVVSFVSQILGFGYSYGGPFGGYYYSNPLTSLLELALLLPSLGIAARRLHDSDRSAWWLLLGIIPVVGWLVLIYWYVQAGSPGPNQFGPVPEQVVAAAKS